MIADIVILIQRKRGGGGVLWVDLCDYLLSLSDFSLVLRPVYSFVSAPMSIHHGSFVRDESSQSKDTLHGL